MKRILTLFLSSLLLLSLVFSFDACKKTDSFMGSNVAVSKITEQFFRISPTEHPLVKRIIAEIKKRNNATPFVTDFARNNGFPRWDKAILAPQPKTVLQRDGDEFELADTLVYVPLVLANTVQVNGSILAKVKGDSIFLKYVLAQDYKAYPFVGGRGIVTADQFATLMLVMNKEVFGHQTFEITDERLFADVSYPDPDTTTKYVSFDTAQVNNLNIPSTSCEYLLVSICGSNSTGRTGARTTPGGPPRNCLTFYEEHCYTIYDDSGGWGGGSSGGTTGGGNGLPGGGGGAPIPHDYPCQTPGTCSQPGGGIGWLPPVAWDDEEYNPYIADSIIIDTSISNNYPCLLNIIDTISSFANLNQKAQVALSSIFGVNKRIHTTFKMDNNLVGTTTNARTVRNGTVPYGQDIDSVDFFATIYLNPDLLNYASKEYIAGTIVHEALHAYIGYYFTLYNQGYIAEADSNIVKSKFPIFWGTVNSNTWGVEINQHQAIANSWVNTIYRSLFTFTNNEMSFALKDSVFRAISWAGLEDTNIFNSQSNSCTMRAINIAAGNSNNPVPFGIVGQSQCATNYTYSQSSLKLKSICQ